MRMKEPLKLRILKQAAGLLPHQHSTTISGPDLAKEVKCTQPIIMYHYETMERLLNLAMDWLKDNDRDLWQMAINREMLCVKSRVKKHINNEMGIK